MQRLLAFAAGMLLLFGASEIASADPVSFFDDAQQTETGQYFYFKFDPTPPANADPGYFIIRGRGDYTTWNTEEYVSFNLDGVMSDDYVGPSYAGTMTYTDGYNDVAWYQKYTLSPAYLAAMLGDGMVEIHVQLSNHVHQPLFDYRLNEWFDNQQAYIEVGIIYNTEWPLHDRPYDLQHYRPVPEPSLLALAGLGGLLVLHRRRRKQKQKQQQQS